jgi:hypothetical protein
MSPHALGATVKAAHGGSRNASSARAGGIRGSSESPAAPPTSDDGYAVGGSRLAKPRRTCSASMARSAAPSRRQAAPGHGHWDPGGYRPGVTVAPTCSIACCRRATPAMAGSTPPRRRKDPQRPPPHRSQAARRQRVVTTRRNSAVPTRITAASQRNPGSNTPTIFTITNARQRAAARHRRQCAALRQWPVSAAIATRRNLPDMVE